MAVAIILILSSSVTSKKILRKWKTLQTFKKVNEYRGLLPESQVLN